MNFLLWTKGFHERTNFNTFKCSDESLPNSSCDSPNHKSAFLHILHDSLVSWKITPLYFFWSKVMYESYAQEGSIRVQIFETFECSDKNLPNSCHFWNNKLVFLQILHHSWVSWDITLLNFFSWNFIYFQQKERIKVQIWWKFTWAIKNLKFCTLMGSFGKNHIKFQVKKYRRVISLDNEEWCEI